jgi:hypothetical protein
MLSVSYNPVMQCYAEFSYAECLYAHAECRYAKCRYAECRGAQKTSFNAAPLKKKHSGAKVINFLVRNLLIFVLS